MWLKSALALESRTQCDNPFMGTEGLILMVVLAASIFTPLILMAVWAVRAGTPGRVARAWLAGIFCAIGVGSTFVDDIVPNGVALAFIFSGWLFLAMEMFIKWFLPAQPDRSKS
jgi:hypothetical protein